MATNGSNSEISLTLAKLAKRGVLGVALSQDEFHDSIDYEVIDAFSNTKRDRSNNDRREIRSVSKLSNTGRAKKNGLATNKHCACDDMIVLPNGNIKQCGCDEAPIIGDVFRGIKEEYECCA